MNMKKIAISLLSKPVPGWEGFYKEVV